MGTGNRPWTEVSALFAPPMTDSFSGGLAFGYFPKSPLAQGADYGLVDVTGNNVAVRADWNALKAQFANTTAAPAAAPSPAVGNGGDTDCPAQSGNFLASTRLPPTPDVGLCNCMFADAWECQPTAEVQSDPVQLGELLGVACGLLSENNARVECDEAIGSDGQAGTYGNWSGCSQGYRLTWAMSAYTALSRPDAERSCDFNGAGVLLPSPANRTQAASATAGCVASFGSPQQTDVPVNAAASAAASTGSSSRSPTATSSAGATGGSPAGAAALQQAMPLTLAALVAVAAGAAVLA